MFLPSGLFLPQSMGRTSNDFVSENHKNAFEKDV